MLLKSITSIKPSLKQAWNQFVLSGKVEDAVVRPVIADSWNRCLHAGIHYKDGFCVKVHSKEETIQLLAEKKILIEIAIPIMKTLCKRVNNKNCIVVIADENGIVLDSVGFKEVLEMRKTLHFLPGSDWSEESVGTNAIGTAIAVDEPICVCGPEHYCKIHHSWSCAAAPIHNSHGQIIGCLNISSIYECDDSHFLGMIVASVRSIEDHYQRIETKEELHAAYKKLKAVISTISEGIVAVDQNRIINHVNAAMAHLLDSLPDELIGKSFEEIIGVCEPIKHIFETGSCIFEEEEFVIQTTRRQVHCMVKAAPIKNEYFQVAGAVISFREIKQVHRITNKMSENHSRFHFHDIIGCSEKMNQLIRKAKIAGKSASTVLLLGESGTGKEVFAQSIHNYSKRKDGPFVAINCAAIPRELIQSELFGYCDGAFTGARKGGRPGKFELANDGTLLLDEIGDMSLDLQVNLLRVLQEKHVVRIGGEKPIPINVRVIAATNNNLWEAVENGTFREDLYYRINVMTLHIPPLRERGDDVDLFVKKILKNMSVKLGKEVFKIDPEVRKTFHQYEWPGNIRELENILEYSINMVDGDVLTKEYLPSYLNNKIETKMDDLETIIPLYELECRAIKNAMEKCDGNITRVAKALEIGRNTLYDKLKKYHISYSSKNH